MNFKLKISDELSKFINNYDDENKPLRLSMDSDDMREVLQQIQTGENYSSYALGYFITSVTELGYFEDAINIVEQLLDHGSLTWASGLANDLYDSNRPLENDALWTKYMIIAGQGGYHELGDMGGDLVHDNYCGLWIPGHHTPDFYLERLIPNNPELEAYKNKIPSLVRHEYLLKKGIEFLLVESSNPDAMPITTVLDEEIIGVITELYQFSAFYP